MVAVLALAAAVGTLIIVASPRHRTFYLRALWPLSGGAWVGLPAAAPTATPVTAPATPSATNVATRDSGAAPPSDGKKPIRIGVADRVPLRLPAPGVPRGWELKEFAGRAEVELVRDDRVAIRLRSERTSFALYRDVIVDLRERPILSWSWKVTRLPATGDGRLRATDDAAAQIYVVFPRWPNPRSASNVIGYVWDTSAPRGTRFGSPKADNVRIIVVESGAARLGAWLEYERDVAADYIALFGQESPRVGKVAVMTDSNDTRSGAEVLIGDLVFSGRI